jgi:ABC-type antimicrobial peptide transport system permease subunit
VLSAVGIFGVISHSVSQRINEFGLRMALGATPKTIMRLVARDAVKLSIVGVAAGCIASYGLGSAVSKLLYGVTATDDATLIVVGVILSLVAIAASLIPARRAASVDPMVALRQE